MDLNRRQILTGAGIAAVAAGVPSKASACIRDFDHPLTVSFWRRLWKRKITWPSQVRDVLHALADGISNNSRAKISSAMGSDSYVEYPNSFINFPESSKIVKGPEIVSRLSQMTNFTRNISYEIDITAIEISEYFVIFQLHGSGSKIKNGYGGVCGEDPERYRTIKFCAYIYMNLNGPVRVKRVIML